MAVAPDVEFAAGNDVYDGRAGTVAGSPRAAPATINCWAARASTSSTEVRATTRSPAVLVLTR
jgi:hypothetical protein